MGIEARCPNGHDVRVKDRFAGKKAYCPECGATFRVPLPKDRSSDARAAEPCLDLVHEPSRRPPRVLIANLISRRERVCSQDALVSISGTDPV